MNALVFCDGLLPSSISDLAKEALEADEVIFCDGVTNSLAHTTISPSVIIGDFDSISPLLLTRYEHLNEVETIMDADQETNDLEKALSYALRKGISEVKIIGALGKRLDHTLKNCSVLQRFSPRFKRLYFWDEYGVSFCFSSQCECKLAAQTTVSLFPLTGKVEGIRTSGLAYALHNESIQNAVRDGTSNLSLHESISISCTSGTLLITIGDPEFRISNAHYL